MVLSHPGCIAMSQGFASSSAAPPPTRIKSLKSTILDEIKTIDDPRTKRQPDHLLVDLVAIGILATLAGANDMVAVATYGQEEYECYTK